MGFEALLLGVCGVAEPTQADLRAQGTCLPSSLNLRLGRLLIWFCSVCGISFEGSYVVQHPCFRPEAGRSRFGYEKDPKPADGLDHRNQNVAPSN